VAVYCGGAADWYWYGAGAGCGRERGEFEERQQQVQQRRQEPMQKQHSAPQKRMRAKHQRREMRIRAPTTMPTIAGYLGLVSLWLKMRNDMEFTHLQYVSAMHESHDENVFFTLLNSDWMMSRCQSVIGGAMSGRSKW